MALGTVTLVRKGVVAPGGLRFAILDVQPTSGANYTAGGEIIPLSNFPKFQNVLFASAEPKNQAAAAADRYAVDFTSPTAPKLMAFVGTTGVERAASQNLSSFTVRIIAFGN